VEQSSGKGVRAYFPGSQSEQRARGEAWDLGHRRLGLGLEFLGVCHRLGVWGLGFRVKSFGGLEFWVLVIGFRVLGFGLGV